MEFENEIVLKSKGYYYNSRPIDIGELKKIMHDILNDAKKSHYGCSLGIKRDREGRVERIMYSLPPRHSQILFSNLQSMAIKTGGILRNAGYYSVEKK